MAVPFEEFFHTYVYGFMCEDIGREIRDAEDGKLSGNFLAALALLTYTEALGHHVPGSKSGSRNKFEAFFRRLGPEYEAFLDSGEKVYDIYRNGMVHGYLPTEPSLIAMLDSPTDPCGVYKKDGRYVFVVRRYFSDFVVAAARLHEEIVGVPHHLIHVWAPNRLP